MNQPSIAYAEGQEALEGVVGSGWVDTPLARSRFLRLSAATLFGGAVALILPSRATAHCADDSPHPCEGYGRCTPNPGCENCESNCCNCSEQNCSADCDSFGDLGCHNGRPCWVTCHNGTRYKCCDCKDNASTDPCICRYVKGSC